VDRIEAADLSGRVEAGSSDDEIANLGLTLNRMLDRLETESRRQQLFAAAASHELRSPLSTIRTELEVGLAYPDRAEWSKVAEDSLIEVARLEDLTRDLRMLTSFAFDAGVGRAVDRVIGASGVRGRPSPPRAWRSLPDIAGARPLMADPDAVVRVIRNLFDNAERHAAGEVRVSVSQDQKRRRPRRRQRWSIDPGRRSRTHLRTVHALDEARSLDIGGSGLGLAIARSIMTALGGSIVALPVDHGAEFKASFPPASTAS
jgi:signal transduction histidine kinase